MDRTRRNLRSTARGRGRATSATRGRGRTIPIGRGRGSETPADHEDIVDPGTTPDPIVEAVANSVPPTTPIDPTAAYQAIQTLVGLFTGQQAQTGLANSMTFDKGTVLDRFFKTTPPSFIGYAGKQVEKEEDKVWYFLKGLRSDIRGRVSLLDVKTLAELVTKALTAENDIKEENLSKEHQFKRTREWWQPGQNNEGGNSNKRKFNEGHQGNSPNNENDVFHDGSDIFAENYKEMNKSLKIYIYPHSTKDRLANVLLPESSEPGGNYVSEAYFKKALMKSHFITKDPSKADFFFLPFSITYMRNDKRIGVGGIPSFVRDYMYDVRHKYPYWNRSGGADHFYVACHSIGKIAMGKAAEVKDNSIQVACSSNYFVNGYVAHKDVPLPQIWPRQGNPP
ncbi:hypothetical protein Vadar_022013 [Vaccinium darrowii]|uniref:Uncharacterized protein n=1 Tax=Vaccinium darrowii TaxID=229202 RepID=A0ACB7YNH9_9ERIC|nr:hypothetical protein Vadar_022013 [Vaccinium darrowii]